MNPVELMSQWSFGGVDWLVIGLGIVVAYLVFGIAGFGTALVAGLALLATLAHTLPLGLNEAPHHAAGWVVALAMGLMYAALVVLQRWPQALSAWRRWSYAGFYVDEVYTRLTLSLWPARWTPCKTDQKDELAPSSSLMAAQD